MNLLFCVGHFWARNELNGTQQQLLAALIRVIALGSTVTHTIDSRCSCRQVYQDFFTDIIPSLKASLRLHKMSSGIKFRPLKESLRRCFSTPFWLHKKNQKKNHCYHKAKVSALVWAHGQHNNCTNLRNSHLLRQGEIVRCESVVQERHSELQTEREKGNFRWVETKIQNPKSVIQNPNIYFLPQLV